MKVLEAEIENKFLSGLGSSSDINFSSFFGSLLFAMFFNKTSEFIKLKFSIKFLTISTFSFSLYLTSFEIISDLELYVKSLGP